MSINWDEPIEGQYNGVWYDAKVEYLGKSVMVISYNDTEFIYTRDSDADWVRNKPQEKWRPFREDELDSLLGQIIRRKMAVDHKMMIVQVLGTLIMTSGMSWFDPKQLLETFELRQDNKWVPCGVKVKE